MNQIRNLRQKAELDMADLARLANVDVAEIAMAENGFGYVRFTTALSICEALEVTLSMLFPDAREVLDAIPDPEDDDFRDTLLLPDTAGKLLSSGLDPDIAPWFAVIRTRSGNERKYLVSSPEKDFLMSALDDATPGRFIRFESDCRNVLLRVDGIAEVKLTNRTSYASFSSHDSAFEITILWANGSRPERFEVIPGPELTFLDQMTEGRGDHTPTFAGIPTEDGDMRFVATDAIDVIEVPIGVIMPEIYRDPRVQAPCSRDDDISSLDPIGTA